jgi:hypothetical protein
MSEQCGSCQILYIKVKHTQLGISYTKVVVVNQVLRCLFVSVKKYAQLGEKNK